MDHIITTLDQLKVGAKGRVTGLGAEGSVRRRFLDLGLINGTEVEVLHKSPAGDPVAYYIRGTVIALRLKEAAKIMIDV